MGARVRGCEAYCDRERTLQVLSNLVGNAIKFCKKGKIVIDCTEQEADVLLAVHDTGPGIPADQLDKIFAPRWHTLQPGREGTGLGLAIAKSLVEAQGGRIWVESEVGRGSSFFFTLPRAAAPGIRSHSQLRAAIALDDVQAANAS
jgi:signal transduction histidine kinase